MKKLFLYTIILFVTLTGCSSVPLDLWSPEETNDDTTGSVSNTAGIYVTEYQADVLIKYSTDGQLEGALYQTQVGENLAGVAKYDKEHLLIAVDGASERIMLLNVVTKETSVYAQHLQFIGTLRKISFDPVSETLLATETNSIEKFVNGTRINNSTTPFIGGLSTPYKALILSNGNIVELNSGSANSEIRIYDSSGTFLNTLGMPPADGNGDPYGVIQPSGSNYFYVAYYNTTNSRIARFELDGSNGTAIFIDTPGNKDCTNPAAMAGRPNGNILVYCYGENGIMEITTDGDIVRSVVFSNLRISQMVEMI